MHMLSASQYGVFWHIIQGICRNVCRSELHQYKGNVKIALNGQELLF